MTPLSAASYRISANVVFVPSVVDEDFIYRVSVAPQICASFCSVGVYCNVTFLT